MRGGTSKGAYFAAADLPQDEAQRDDLLLRIMGSPDPRQIDGIGGAHPLTSKVAVVGPSERPGVDVDYLFLQVGVGEALVTDRQNCGNLLAGVGAFAIERGMVAAKDPSTEVEIFMCNTDSRATAVLSTPNGAPSYAGGTAISGVPGTAAPVSIYFADIEGATCGALLPTGHLVDQIDGVPVTCIDNGMPVVLMTAAAIGVAGDETCAELEADSQLRERIEHIRRQAGPLMGLGDVEHLTVPKMTIIDHPRAGGTAITRSFIPHRCHDAIGVLAAVSVATACVLPGSVASEVAHIEDPAQPISLEHPTGTFEVVIDLDASTDPPTVPRAGVLRTARKLFDGIVYPRS
jgi:4-oxalomesaconate tautomerase